VNQSPEFLSSSASPESLNAESPDSEQPSSSAGDSSEPTIHETSDAIQAHRKGFWRVFFSTFGAIFLAELGDKTQLATLLMSAESGEPWVVFLGAGTALVMTSLIGVALGRWISRRVSPHTLDTAAGAVLLAITVWLLWDVVHL